MPDGFVEKCIEDKKIDKTFIDDNYPRKSREIECEAMCLEYGISYDLL